jgi:signal transduction histidine kinase
LKEAKDLGFLRQDINQLLAESKDGTDRVRRIVQNLKDFSHVSEEEWSWADLQKGIESTLNLVWNEIKYKAEVDKQFGDLPAVYCMPSQLNQVFMNLLVNAAQAIESKGKITIRSGFEEGTLQEEARVWIEIEDTGKGIPAENLTRIFDPFFTTKPVGKGTGLGLSLAWSIVRKHKGTIKVSSELGKGTTFLIVLPVERVDDEAPDDATDAATNETTQPS